MAGPSYDAHDSPYDPYATNHDIFFIFLYLATLGLDHAIILCYPVYMLCYFPFLCTFMRLTRLPSVPMLPGIVPTFSDVVYLSRCTFASHSQQNTTASVPLLVPESRVK